MNKLLITIPLLSLMLGGCNIVKRAIGVENHNTHSVSASVNDQFTNLRTLITDETGIDEVNDVGDILALSRWTRSKLEKPMAERLALMGRVAPQHAGYYFEAFLKDSGTDARTAWCQRNALSFGEVLKIFNVDHTDIHYVDNIGTGLHQFTEYRLRGMTGVIDQYYGVVYLDNGRPVSKRVIQARRASLNDTDMLAWVHSIETQYNPVPEQALHDVAQDWLVGQFVGGF